MKFYPGKRQGGSAVIVMLALLTLMLIFVGFNLRSLYGLDRELKLAEQRQLRRLDASAAPAAAPFQHASTKAPVTPGATH